MRASLALAALVTLLGASAIGAAPGSAATIGQTDPSANYLCAAETDLQTAVASGTSFVVPPGSWLLTSWSTDAGSFGGAMSLMIFRPTAVAGSYTVLAESPVRTLSPGTLNTFATRLVVHGGDLLGFWSGNLASCATFNGLFADLNPYAFGPEPAVGATVATTTAPGYRLNISATISSADDLLATLLSDSTGKGPGTSLGDKVGRVQAYLASNDAASACTTLSDFVSEVKAQTGKSLGTADAAKLTAEASDVTALLGC